MTCQGNESRYYHGTLGRSFSEATRGKTFSFTPAIMVSAWCLYVEGWTLIGIVDEVEIGNRIDGVYDLVEL